MCCKCGHAYPGMLWAVQVNKLHHRRRPVRLPGTALLRWCTGVLGAQRSLLNCNTRKYISASAQAGLRRGAQQHSPQVSCHCCTTTRLAMRHGRFSEQAAKHPWNTAGPDALVPQLGSVALCLSARACVASVQLHCTALRTSADDDNTHDSARHTWNTAGPLPRTGRPDAPGPQLGSAAPCACLPWPAWPHAGSCVAMPLCCPGPHVASCTACVYTEA